MKKRVLFLAALLTASVFTMAQAVSFEPIATYSAGAFNESAAEIGAYDAASQRLFVVNGDTGAVDVFDISNPTILNKIFSIDLSPYGNQANSVATHNGIVAVAVEADNKQEPGQAVFFDADGNLLNAVTVGALPDMLTFTPDGNRVLVANEGEPNDAVTVDPEGSVSIIDISGGVAGLTQANVTHAGFTGFNNAVLAPSIRIFTPGSTVAQDLEPEYIAVNASSTMAWVVCQENNALAVLDILSGTFTQLIGLGFKDHSLPANALDPSNRDDAINIGTWPIYGMYQPDAIAAYEVNGQTYLVTANEGDARDYDGFSEEERIKDLTLDPTAFPNAATLQEDENLGRLNSTTTLGDTDNDGDYDQLYSYGARSFTIWDANGQIIFDSGDDIERHLAEALPTQFNSNNDDNDSFDSRSDDKGPEPEGLTIARLAGRYYLFLGLERVGGVMMYDISNPVAPVLIQYVNNRNFAVDAETAAAGDLGPEGLTFIAPSDSPTHQPLLAVMNEVSGTTTLYRINLDCASPEIVNLAPVGQSGITVSGSIDCLYDVEITDENGQVTIHQVLVGANGLGVLDYTIRPNLSIRVGLNNVFTGPAVQTVPTLGTWGLIIFATMLMAATIIMRRRQRQV